MTQQRGVVVIFGGTGLVGQALGRWLAKAGYQLRVVSRKAQAIDLSYPAELFYWQDDFVIPEAVMIGADYVVNLAGDSVAEGRWTSTKKRKILLSRTMTTDAIMRALKQHPVRCLVQASAIGYYGATGAETVTEASRAGDTFLASVTQQWEQCLAGLSDTVRCVVARLGGRYS